MACKKVALATAVTAALGTMAPQAHAQVGQINWFGSVYAKFLDGNRKFENALYNNAEATPGEAAGDQGQGIEFELMFNAQVSRQVEIGGRIKARFNRNFWSNFGGFGPDEFDPRSAQYMKLRGVWATLTPGYDWVDSVTIGSNDFGMFDPFTQGKFRYIDRDNASGIVMQGKAADGDVRWDLARASLSRLFQGPRFLTSDQLPGGNPDKPDANVLEANDVAWTGQLRWSPLPDINLTGIVEYIDDQEIDQADADLRDGQRTSSRFDQRILGLKGTYSGLPAVDIGGAFYFSDFRVDENVCPDVGSNPNLVGDPNCRFSPTLMRDASDVAMLLNLGFNDLGIDDFTISVQGFHIGAEYNSVTSARRESDVLLTEGLEPTWGWGRPDYNSGDRNLNLASNGVGYGGWNGEAQQVVSLMADNDFTDFDEPWAHTVIGWSGVTIQPKYLIGDWELTAEYTFVDYDTNWQACDVTSPTTPGSPKADCIYPRQEGIHSWGLGGDYRSPYAPYQDKQTQIFSLRANYLLDIGGGVDLTARYKFIDDTDDRVTVSGLLNDAYDLYPAASIDSDEYLALRDSDPDSLRVTNVAYDDREADYFTLGFSAGYQLTPDLYGRLIYERHEVDLVDGSINVAPVGLGFEASNSFGFAEYLSGEHVKNRIGVEFNYFLSGVEIGASVDWLFGSYDPVFLQGENGRLVLVNLADTNNPRVLRDANMNPTAVVTPLGNISVDQVTLEQYRLKAFMKVSF